MSLLPNNTFLSPGQPIYGSSGGATGNPAPQFVATGLAGAGGFISQGAGANVILNEGRFVSYANTTVVPPGGTDVVVLGSDALGLNGTRWTIGYNNADVDNFTGADLAIKCYANDGNPIATPIVIERDTGITNITEGLVVNEAKVGDETKLDGGILNIDGRLGLSRVYDELYNPPPGQSPVVYATSLTKYPTGLVVDGLVLVSTDATEAVVAVDYQVTGNPPFTAIAMPDTINTALATGEYADGFLDVWGSLNMYGSQIVTAGQTPSVRLYAVCNRSVENPVVFTATDPYILYQFPPTTQPTGSYGTTMPFRFTLKVGSSLFPATPEPGIDNVIQLWLQHVSLTAGYTVTVTGETTNPRFATVLNFKLYN